MRLSAGPLLTFLNSSDQFIMVDLYAFELRNGTVLRYSTASAPITFSGFVYLPAPAGITRSSIRWVTGIEVDTLDIEFPADASILVGTVPLLAAAVKGQFDNARVTLMRLFLSDWSTPVGSVMLFQGNTAPAKVLRSMLQLTVKSDLERLNVQIPDTVYQATCSNTLYDASCGVNRETYKVAGSVSSVNANGSLGTNLVQPDAYFQMGSMKFTSGQNAGLVRTVKSYTGGTLYPSNPFPFPVAPGDAFTVNPGCDKIRTGNCLNRYNNTGRFIGFEFIPAPETAA